MQNTKINYELEESAPPELSPTKEQVISLMKEAFMHGDHNELLKLLPSIERDWDFSELFLEAVKQLFLQPEFDKGKFNKAFIVINNKNLILKEITRPCGNSCIRKDKIEFGLDNAKKEFEGHMFYSDSDKKEEDSVTAIKRVMIKLVKDSDISILRDLQKLIEYSYTKMVHSISTTEENIKTQKTLNCLCINEDQKDKIENALKTETGIAIMRQLLYSHIPLVDQGNTLFHHIALEKRSNKSEKKVQDYFKVYIEIAGKLSHDPITGDYYNLDVINKHGHTGKDILSLLDEELSSFYGVRTNEDKVQSRFHNVVAYVIPCLRGNSVKALL